MDPSSCEGRSQSEASGCPADAPQLLLKSVCFADARGVVSARKRAPAGREAMTCMALSWALVPDQSPLAGLVASRPEEMVSRCRDVLRVCEEPGWCGGTPCA
jgi:hypothetical protein